MTYINKYVNNKEYFVLKKSHNLKKYMKKQVINVGIVGLGEHMIRAHVKHLALMKNVLILKYFDPNTEADTSCFEQLIHQPIRTDFEEILKDEQIDVVFIGSPDKYHTEQLLRCVEAGKSVFCEKPMAINMEERFILRDALKIAKEKGLVVSSCHPRRFDPPFVWLKEKLNDRVWVEENFGKITDFNFDFWYHKVTDEWKKDRSLLKDHFGHEIDLYRFLFGASHTWVAKALFDGYDKYKVVGMAEDKNFPDFIFTGYRSLDESVYQETVTIKGAKNALVMQLNTGEYFWMKDFIQGDFPKINYEERFTLVNENFINAVLKKTEPYLSHKDMLVNNIHSIELLPTEDYLPFEYSE